MLLELCRIETLTTAFTSWNVVAQLVTCTLPDVERNSGEAELPLFAALPALPDRDGRLPHEQRSPRGGGEQRRKRQRPHHHDGRQRGDHDDDQLRLWGGGAQRRRLWRRWGITAVRAAELRLRVCLRRGRVLLQRVRGRPVQGGVHQLVGSLERAAAAAAAIRPAVGVQSPGGEMILGGRSVFVPAQRVAIEESTGCAAAPVGSVCDDDAVGGRHATFPVPSVLPLPSPLPRTRHRHPFVVRLNTFTFRASIVLSAEGANEHVARSRAHRMRSENHVSLFCHVTPTLSAAVSLHRNTSSSCDRRSMPR